MSFYIMPKRPGKIGKPRTIRLPKDMDPRVDAIAGRMGIKAVNVIRMAIGLGMEVLEKGVWTQETPREPRQDGQSSDDEDGGGSVLRAVAPPPLLRAFSPGLPLRTM